MALKPLPPPEFPLAGVAPPTQMYAEYLGALDQLLRSNAFPTAPATDTNATGHALSAANLLNGILLRSGPGAGFSDTTPTAAEIVAAIPKPQVNTSRFILIANAGGGLLTMLAGSSVTLAGNTTIAADSGRFYLVTVTSPAKAMETVTLRGLITASM